MRTVLLLTIVGLAACASSSVDSAGLQGPVGLLNAELRGYLAADTLIPAPARDELLSAMAVVETALGASETIDLQAYAPQLRSIAQAHGAYVGNDPELSPGDQEAKRRTGVLLLRLVDEAGG